MKNFNKEKAISALTPMQYRVTQQNGTEPPLITSLMLIIETGYMLI